MDTASSNEQEVQRLYEAELQRVRARADRAFLWLMGSQWLFGIFCAVAISPQSWSGFTSTPHPHLFTAIVLGGGVVCFPAYLILAVPRTWLTRWTVAAAQALMSALLIHLMAGRIEAHFHIFGVLAFLSFYRDRSVYVPAVALVAIDHLVRGVFWPESVFGLATPQVLRALEHAGWVLFETSFLCLGVAQSQNRVRETCSLQVDLQQERDQLDKRITQRTGELSAAREFLSMMVESLEAEKANADRLALVAKHTNNGVVITDADFLIEWVNDGFTRLSGYSLSEVVGKDPILLLQDDETDAGVVEHLRDEIGKREASNAQLLSRTKDGKPYWVAVEIRPILDEAGKLANFILLQHDITQRRKNESRLQELSAELIVNNDQIAKEQALIQAIVDSIPHGVFWKNDDLTYGGCNAAFATLAGLDSAAEIVGKDDFDLPWPQEDSENYRRLDRKILRGEEKLITLEEQIPRPDGAIAELMRTKSPLKSDCGGVVGMVGVVADITKLKESERERERLQLESTELARILRESPDEVYIFDRETLHFVEANQGACIASGYSELELVGMTPLDLKPDYDEAKFNRLVEPLNCGEKTHLEFQTDHLRKNGERYPARISLHATDYGGKPVFVAFVSDLTEMQNLEKRLSRAQKLEAVGQLSAGLAHEINTPMQFVSDNIEFVSQASDRIVDVIDYYDNLLHEAMPTDWDERREQAQQFKQANRFDHARKNLPAAIADCREGVRRTVKIIKAMKDFSHPGTRTRTKVDVNEAIEATLTISHNRWKYNAESVVELDGTLPRVPAFASELNQVLLNLVVNAADAIKERWGEGELGLIKIRSRRADDHVEIEIEDNGGGIPEDIREKVFDPFFTTKEVGKGTGQGLAIARDAIVTMHGGYIDTKTELGVGTTFTIGLPLGDLESDDEPSDTQTTDETVSV